MDYLVAENYQPDLAEDGEIIFKHEGGTYVLYPEQDDSEYFRLVFPAFWEIESETERLYALQVMSAINNSHKVLKMYLYNDNIYAAIEMFIDPIENFKNIFDRSMRVLVAGALAFREEMREIMVEIQQPESKPN